MREIRDRSFDIDRFLEDAVRAKQQLDSERWREELRPRALRLFAARTTKLQWSRALLKLVVHELYPDDLFSELIGNLDRIPRRRWPQVIALAEQFETNPRSVWGYVQGLTRLSQRTPWQDGRFTLDRAAGRLLTTVH